MHIVIVHYKMLQEFIDMHWSMKVSVLFGITHTLSCYTVSISTACLKHNQNNITLKQWSLASD